MTKNKNSYDSGDIIAVVVCTILGAVILSSAIDLVPVENTTPSNYLKLEAERG